MRERRNLNLAIEVTQKKRDALARQWLVLHQDADCAQEQHKLLANYAIETQSRWSLRSSHATPQMVMQQNYRFLEKLEAAITMQKDVVADKDLKCTNKRLLWTQAEQRVQILQRYQRLSIEKHQAKVLKKEQKQTDEFAIQLGRIKKSKVST
ncbi:flagellar export protein FliJ [Limnohabitans sp. DM1]|uniref:flagellar export protein FliJ n=1 Tax=Limnohabitans sp. DM1 TaxID=1597955 RepID=UPI000A798608|nr:flagellar export protein FliJ [Limnohabitans sp. DM1]